jgi:hypothetical protein
MPTKSEVFPSPWLKAEDLKGKPVTVKVAGAGYEKLKSPSGAEQRKMVLTFHKTDKRLPLNLTNFDSMVDITGEGDSDDWVGHRIELFPTQTAMQGKLVDCIRIRKPPQASLPITPPAPNPPSQLADAVDPDMDDEIPWK